jgi:ribonuclease T2
MMVSSSLIISLLALVLSCEANKMSGDMFVFAYSWQAEFCFGQTTYAGCSPPQDYWKTHFTLHGLWPQYSTGGYPQTCTTEAFDPNVPYAIGWSDMTKYWPDAQYAETDPNYNSFWAHEWTKHGTCTGLAQQDYFQTTINLLKSFGSPQILADAVGQNISASALRDSMGGPTMAALQCNAGVYLSGVFTCWSQENGYPKTQVTCPGEVQKEDTCSGASLVVTSF